MKLELKWLDDALASKDIVLAMTHYRVKDRMMTATNGRIVAGHPCNVSGEFLVPGVELKQIFNRLEDEPKITIKDERVHLSVGRFRGSLQIMPSEEWRFPDLEGEIKWKAFPDGLIAIMRDLRPFVSENAVHSWSLGIAIDDGWCYASNNIILAGAQLPKSKGVKALLPGWAMDFLLQRGEGLCQWAFSDHYMAFRWENGAWMRSTLIDNKFPEKAGQMIREATEPTQKVNDQYRKAVIRVAELSDEFIAIYADHIEGRTELSIITETLKNEVPTDSEFSLWGAKHLASVINVATAWQPAAWPKPSPFRGERIQGYIAGRMA